jgi:hypothetical protein
MQEACTYRKRVLTGNKTRYNTGMEYLNVTVFLFVRSLSTDGP